MRPRPRFPVLSSVASLILLLASASSAQIDTGIGDENDLGFSSGSLIEHAFSSLELKVPPEGQRGFVSRTPTGLELSKQISFTPTALPQLRSSAPRYATLRLGRGGKTQVIFDQSDPKTGIYNLLYIDHNRDGDLTNDGEPARAKVAKDEQRGLPYIEFTGVPFTVYYSQGLEAEHRFTFYYWLRTEADFDRVSYVSACWREGTVKLEGAEARVYFYDEDGDAMYLVPNLRWALLPSDAKLDGLPEMVSVELPLRFNGKPWKISALMPEGQRVELELETEAHAKRSILEVDRTATEPPRARAEAPMEFATDFEAAKAKAATEKKPLLVVFETSWSPSGKLLRERTLMDAEVQQLMREKFVSVAIDFDRERLIAARYDVTAVPTIVIVDSKGVVSDRIIGYRQAAILAERLRTWRP